MVQFSIQVLSFVTGTKTRMTQVYRASLRGVIGVAQLPVARGGRMPVDTSFLRQSLYVTLRGTTVMTGAEGFGPVIDKARIEDPVTFGWLAHYAEHVEAGVRGRPGRFFMRGAAQQWNAIVEANILRSLR